MKLPPPGIRNIYPEDERRLAAITPTHRVFRGTYGGYSDNFFCGLNCGYRWGIPRSGLRRANW